ncbi:MAG: flagella basal body P-ring formation protein FlgA [bacterium]
MRKKNYIYIFCILIFMMLVITNITEGTQIKIPSSVKVNKSRIALTDIAQINNVSEEILNKLKNIDLGKVPLAGYSRKINRQIIEMKIKNAGISSDKYQLDMEDQVIISLDTRDIKKEELLASIKNHIRKNIPGEEITEENIDIEVSFMPEEIKVPAKEFKLKFETENPEELLGNISLPVNIVIEDEIQKKIYTGLKVSLEKEVYTARKNLIRGNKIEKDNFEARTRKLTRFKNDYIGEWDESFEDKVISTPIEKGEILSRKHISSEKSIFKNLGMEIEKKEESKNKESENIFNDPYLIRWGEEVTAEVVVGDIKATTTVKSRESGNKGDIIIVENISSGKRLSAEIIETDLVKVKN